MAARDNPYFISPPNVYEALMAGYQGFDRAQKQMSENEAREARKRAQAAIEGGDTRGALAALIGANDPKMAAVLSQHQQGASGVYGTPIYGTDPKTGETVLGAIGKQGQFHRIDTGGVQPTPGVKMMDTGTGFVPVQSRTGQPVGGGAYQPGAAQPVAGGPQAPVGFIPKDLVGAERQKKFGKDQGETQANLAAMKSKLPGLKVVVEELGKLADKATFTTAGQILDASRTQLNMEPREAAIARTKYIAMVDNQILPLLRETFGAQFTEREGQSLKVTLGDPNKTPKEKRAVLDAFIEQKIRNIEATAAQVGQNMNLTGDGKTITGIDYGQPTGPVPPKIGEVRSGYRYKGGNPSDPSSWVGIK